ncbi:A disintegrin and metalloproteinase with thrombospondin motifs 18-like [Tachypleus tridentatus]|uniref:A disintegrin and metalloproteinase with thrombospondin motifs 18-like n=1 Tax=Tachypleus tridentatus TaxID=6853 RepID=UPI003FD5B797
MWKLLFFLQCLYVIGDCLTKVLALGDSLSLQQKEKSIDPLTDYEIVFPVQVDSEGNYLTHQLNPFETYDHDLTRRKQEATDNGSFKVFYSITGFGQQFHLEVFPSTVFLGPGFKVYKLNSNKQRKLFTETPGDEVRNCLYSGRIKQQEESSTIALNVCNGLRGLIQTRDENFLIEPIQEENFNVNRNSSYRSKGIVHKLSKRSVSHNTGSVTELSRTKPQTYYCGQKRECKYN